MVSCWESGTIIISPRIFLLSIFPFSIQRAPETAAFLSCHATGDDGPLLLLPSYPHASTPSLPLWMPESIGLDYASVTVVNATISSTPKNVCIFHVLRTNGWRRRLARFDDVTWLICCGLTCGGIFTNRAPVNIPFQIGSLSICIPWAVRRSISISCLAGLGGKSSGWKRQLKTCWGYRPMSSYHFRLVSPFPVISSLLPFSFLKQPIICKSHLVQVHWMSFCD